MCVCRDLKTLAETMNEDKKMPGKLFDLLSRKVRDASIAWYTNHGANGGRHYSLPFGLGLPSWVQSHGFACDCPHCYKRGLKDDDDLRCRKCTRLQFPGEAYYDPLSDYDDEGRPPSPVYKPTSPAYSPTSPSYDPPRDRGRSPGEL